MLPKARKICENRQNRITVNPEQQNVRIATERVRDARCTRSPLIVKQKHI